jgi:hypothetical protein
MSNLITNNNYMCSNCYYIGMFYVEPKNDNGVWSKIKCPYCGHDAIPTFEYIKVKHTFSITKEEYVESINIGKNKLGNEVNIKSYRAIKGSIYTNIYDVMFKVTNIKLLTGYYNAEVIARLHTDPFIVKTTDFNRPTISIVAVNS